MLKENVFHFLVEASGGLFCWEWSWAHPTLHQNAVFLVGPSYQRTKIIDILVLQIFLVFYFKFIILTIFDFFGAFDAASR